MPHQTFPKSTGFISHLMRRWKIRWLDEPSVNHISEGQSVLLLLVQLLLCGVTLAVRHHPEASCYGLRCLTKVLPRPVRSKSKLLCPQGEAFSAVHCSPFNVKIPNSVDKIAARATQATLFSISWARSHLYFVFVFFCSFKGQLAEIAYVTTTKKRFGCGIQSHFKTDWKLSTGGWQDGWATFHGWNLSNPAVLQG